MPPPFAGTWLCKATDALSLDPEDYVYATGHYKDSVKTRFRHWPIPPQRGWAIVGLVTAVSCVHCLPALMGAGDRERRCAPARTGASDVVI
jgi:hypothetical protein